MTAEIIKIHTNAVLKHLNIYNFNDYIKLKQTKKLNNDNYFYRETYNDKT